MAHPRLTRQLLPISNLKLSAKSITTRRCTLWPLSNNPNSTKRRKGLSWNKLLLCLIYPRPSIWALWHTSTNPTTCSSLLWRNQRVKSAARSSRKLYRSVPARMLMAGLTECFSKSSRMSRSKFHRAHPTCSSTSLLAASHWIWGTFKSLRGTYYWACIRSIRKESLIWTCTRLICS